jgi:acid stress-induced BolA-like protein IbaG/YrbA
MHKVCGVFLLFCCLQAICFGPGDSIAANPIPDLSKVNWMVLGPFSNPQNPWSGCQGFQNDLLIKNGGEANIRPVIGKNIEGLHWKSCWLEKGQLDFGALFGPMDNQVAYAYCEFFSQKPQIVALHLGSDDGIKAWFNGRLIFSHHIHRSLLPGEDAVSIQLMAGMNRLLLKIDQGNGGWGCTAELRNIETDIVGWNQVKQKKYRICLDNQFQKNSRLGFTVLTKPSFAVGDKVQIQVRDLDGNMVTRKTVVTGELNILELPSQKSGNFNMYQLNLVSAGMNQMAGMDKTQVVNGDIRQMIHQEVIRARSIAQLRLPNQSGEDFSATLSFLADQLEGKTQASLETPERNLRALTTIHEICRKVEAVYHGKRIWPIASFRGIRQWAYRSSIDGSCQPYTIYLPENYNPVKQYKLLICLHGYSGDDYSSVQTALTDASPDDFIIAAPYGRGDLAYAGIGEQDVLDVMDLVQKTYSIDPDQVYITGWSMGGCGTWRFGQFYSDRFAAMAPFCGWTSEKYLVNLKNLPSLVVHGNADTVVPIEKDQYAAVSRLSEVKAPCFFEELPGISHDAWGGWLKIHNRNGLFDFFRKYRRNRWPVEIELSIPNLRYGRQYWMQIEDFINPQKTGSIHAEVVDSRHLWVETDNIHAFTLDLNHPRLARGGRILIEINGFGVPTDAGSHRVTFENDDKKGSFTRVKFAAGACAKHLGGGMADLFNGPLCIVYGTKNFRHTKDLRHVAEILADWRVSSLLPYGTKFGRFRIKADKDITLFDQKRYHLLLLGTVDENLLTEQFMKRKNNWPFWMDSHQVKMGQWKYSNAGLFLIYPNPNHRMRLIGFWSFPFPKQIQLDLAVRVPMAMTQYALDDGVGSFTTPDWMIYQNSGQIVKFGYFDFNWKRMSEDRISQTENSM